MVRRSLPDNTVLVEPETGARFIPDDNAAYRKQVPINDYVRLEDYTPPRIWGQFKPEVLDSFAQKMYWPEWKRSADYNGDALLGIDTVLKIVLARSRKYVEDEHGLIDCPGTITWVNFWRTPPCWVIIDDEEGHRMLFDDQYRLLGGKERVTGEAFGLAKPRAATNTWGGTSTNPLTGTGVTLYGGPQYEREEGRT